MIFLFTNIMQVLNCQNNYTKVSNECWILKTRGLPLVSRQSPECKLLVFNYFLVDHNCSVNDQPRYIYTGSQFGKAVQLYIVVALTYNRLFG